MRAKTHPDFVTVAVRGDRCLLTQSVWERDGFELPILMVFECDAEGSLLAADFFDESDRVQAEAELNTRAAAITRS